MSFHDVMAHIRLEIIIILVFFTFFIFLDTKNTKNSLKSSKWMRNIQNIHIHVEKLKEIFFHALSSVKIPETVEISILEKVF